MARGESVEGRGYFDLFTKAKSAIMGWTKTKSRITVMVAGGIYEN